MFIFLGAVLVKGWTYAASLVAASPLQVTTVDAFSAAEQRAFSNHCDVCTELLGQQFLRNASGNISLLGWSLGTNFADEVA